EHGTGSRPALQLPIAFPGGVGGAVEGEAAVVEDRGAGTQLARGLPRVRYEDERHSGGAEILDPALALLLESLVADGEHLVDDEDVGLNVLRDGEPETRI